MKRLLVILGAFGLTATGATSVVACNNKNVADNDLSKVKSITAPTVVTAVKSESVTKDEVKTALAANVLLAVQGIAKTAKADDFTYDVFKDNKGTTYSNVNLKTGTADVYVKITAAKGKKVVVNSSGYIKVTLPKEGTVDKKDIAGTTVVYQQLIADSSKKYSDLLANQTLITAVVTGIKTKTSLDTVVTTDFTLTSDKTATASQAAGGVKITVTAATGSTKISGKFDFTILLKAATPAKKDITGTTVVDPQLTADTSKKYSDLLANQTLITAVVTGIKTKTSLDTVVTTDFTLTSDKTATASQAAGGVKITVTAATGSTKISGKFDFTILLKAATPAKKDITGTTVVDPQLTADTSKKYSDLLANQTLITAVVTGIKTKTSLDTVVTTDFTLTSDKTATASQAAGSVKITVTAAAGSTKISGTFEFTITLK